MWKPKYFHEMTTKHRVEDDARVGRASRGWPGSPAASSVWSASPPGWSISDHTTAVTTSESTNGAKKRIRSSARPFRRWLRIQRDPERERELHRQREHDEDAVVLQRAAEDVVVERALEVVQADEVVGEREPVPLVAAVVEGLEDRRRPPAGSRARGRAPGRARSRATCARPGAPRPPAILRAGPAPALLDLDRDRLGQAAGGSRLACRSRCRRPNRPWRHPRSSWTTCCGDALPANSCWTASLTACPTAGAYAWSR